MALVKTSKIGAPSAAPSTPRQEGAPGRAANRRKPSAAPQDKLSERIAAATEELASGIAEASAAAEELRRSMEQIAAGAEQAAGASQEQLAAIRAAVSSLATARTQAELSRRRTDAVQVVLAESGVQITASVAAIERNAARQSASVAVMSELERRAEDIGEITQSVGRISDQTNLLALNAAIEAAKAGEQGRGFAVVADEVRALAETAERNAHEVQGLSQTILDDLRQVSNAVAASAEGAVAEARRGAGIVEGLERFRGEMASITAGSDEILTAALEAERAASEAQRGAEQVASAAEEQSSAAAEAQGAIQQQVDSLEQGGMAAQVLAGLAEDIRAGQLGGAAAEQIAATAEELSATIQELSGAASQIMAAVEQINRGSQQQAAATQQTSAALSQIEESARRAQANGAAALGRVQGIAAALQQSRGEVKQLIAGVSATLEDTRTGQTTIARLEGLGRRIEKIVDGIALVAVQTSMLAVSGSVEAARAGERGRGFSLVSQDIRNLAREASESTDRAKDSVRGILDQAANLRREMEQIITAAEIEVQNNQAITAALERLDADVALLAEAARTIVNGAEEILGAAVQMAAGARQIATAAEEASAASRQAATAATQQARGAEDLAAAVEEIASLSDELKQQNG